ncbi:MAG: hypothetical protein COY40_01170 [Alphaproteobacteria bacterium CG_4_10_14_0_8_um_filter_53_9]|nr:MAG: hypothetical protein COY40_01170 [Alphaproteobacteria bacterium CG_4_10_14_0_8_um_filter_53_9]
MTNNLTPLITWADDGSAAQLAEALITLEQHMANLHALSGRASAPLAAGSEVTKLRNENETLKTRQTEALTRLDNLMMRLEPLMQKEFNTPSKSQEAA